MNDLLLADDLFRDCAVLFKASLLMVFRPLLIVEVVCRLCAAPFLPPTWAILLAVLYPLRVDVVFICREPSFIFYNIIKIVYLLPRMHVRNARFLMLKPLLFRLESV